MHKYTLKSQAFRAENCIASLCILHECTKRPSTNFPALRAGFAQGFLCILHKATLENRRSFAPGFYSTFFVFCIKRLSKTFTAPRAGFCIGPPLHFARKGNAKPTYRKRGRLGNLLQQRSFGRPCLYISKFAQTSVRSALQSAIGNAFLTTMHDPTP